jgi:GMP synthase-like glutamine amidotransferase
MRRIGILQHHPAEGPGRIANWAKRRDITTEIVDAQRLFTQGPVDLTTKDWDALILLGGPWYIDQAPAWLQVEIAATKQWLATDRPAFGICLGSQIMAAALGAHVGPIATPEYGWTEIQLTEYSSQRTLRALQWHEHGFDLPADTASLGSTPACAHQGFRRGAQWAVQFHPEWDDETLAQLVAAFRDEIPFYIEPNDEAQLDVARWFDCELDLWREACRSSLG